MENFSELYFRGNVVVTSAMDAIEPLPIMEELDAIPTLEEPVAKPLEMMASPRPDQALQDHPFAASTRHPLPVLE